MTQTARIQLSVLARPEVVVICTALLVLMIDVTALRGRSDQLRRSVAAVIGSLGCVAAMCQLAMQSASAVLPSGVFLVNPTTRLACFGVLGLTIAVLLLSVHTDAIEHFGEYVLLILLASVGMMFLISTQNLLVLFASLELLSLSLYLLTAFDKRKAKAAEASLKYFLFGGMSAAFLLYGFSLLYGLANSADLSVIGSVVGQHASSSFVLLAAVTTTIGLGFKVAAVPFHFWVPDVYECAPNPVAAFIASASKLASLFAFFTILTVGFGPFAGSAGWFHVTHGWAPVIAGLAVLSMVLGNLGALAQTSLRRLLAYSAIAHSGYMLIAIVSHTTQSLGALIFYVFSYGISVIGTFAVIAIVERSTGDDRLDSFNGLSRRMPFLSACLFVFLLSQAGIPPLAGFFGKFYLFISAVAGANGDRGLLWLVMVALAMSAVSLYYYLQVLKRVFIADPPTDAGMISSPISVRFIVSLLALITVVLGCAPYTIVRWIQSAISTTYR